MERVEHLKGHLAPNPTTAQGGVSQTQTFGKIGVKADDDVVIVASVRSAIAKARKGAFKDSTPDQILVQVLKGLMEKANCKMDVVQEMCLGNVGTPGAYALPARTSELLAGFPVESAVRTVNRQCSSGSQAIADIAADIKAGYIDVGIGAGVEHMSSSGPPGDPSTLPPFDMSSVFEHPVAAGCLLGMGETSENVAAKYGITRAQQDEFAVKSHAKASKAIKSGYFKDEIIPVKAMVTDKDGNEKEVVVENDEGAREGTNVEGLSKLKAAFRKGGSTTAGNASQVSDGAAATLLMRRSMANKLGLKPIGVFRGFKVVGCEPSIMGVGPAVAIPELLKDQGLTVNDIDIFELNEAFASQALYCAQKLNIPEEKLNPNGGAIAIGHPLGMTGARMTATLFNEMKRLNKKTGVVSMCIGTGMGAASLFEAE